MDIAKDTIVAFHYTLSNEAGETIEDSRDGEPMVYLHGRRGILHGLEQALTGKAEGDAVSVTLPPERAYGIREPDAQQRVPVKHLLNPPKRLRPGMAVKVNAQGGPRDAVVIKVGKFNVDLDTNHPLAGQTVTFDVEIIKVREALATELAHGHPHGVDGTAHHH